MGSFYFSKSKNNEQIDLANSGAVNIIWNNGKSSKNFGYLDYLFDSFSCSCNHNSHYNYNCQETQVNEEVAHKKN